MKFGKLPREDCIVCGKEATHYVKKFFEFHYSFCKECYLEYIKIYLGIGTRIKK